MPPTQEELYHDGSIDGFHLVRGCGLDALPVSRHRFLNLSTFDIGAGKLFVLCIAGCLAAPLASTHETTVSLSPQL